MREIKFRGLRTDGKGGVYGMLFHNNKIVTEKVSYESPLVEKGSPNYKYEYINIIPKTVGQFTGLKDKNGKEIYEGDVLICHEYESSDCINKIVQTFKNAVVGYNQGCFFYFPKGNMNCPHQLLMHAYESEIIGNIHENPELLK